MPQPTLTEPIDALYRRAFADFGALALWNMRQARQPTTSDALLVAEALRRNGNLPARRMAEQIETACRGAH